MYDTINIYLANCEIPESRWVELRRSYNLTIEQDVVHGYILGLRIKYQGERLWIQGSWRKAIKGNNYLPVDRSELITFSIKLEKLLEVSLQDAKNMRVDFCYDLEIKNDAYNYMKRMIGIDHVGLKRDEIRKSLYFQNKTTLTFVVYDKAKEIIDKNKSQYDKELLRLELRDERSKSQCSLRELLSIEKFESYNEEVLSFIKKINFDIHSSSPIINLANLSYKEAKESFESAMFKSNPDKYHFDNHIYFARGKGAFRSSDASKLKKHCNELMKGPNIQSKELYKEFIELAEKEFIRIDKCINS